LRSEDGAYEKTVKGVTGNNLKSMLNYEGSANGFYPTKNADETTALVYYTEVYGIASANYGEVVADSAVTGAVADDLTIGIPAGFTNLYKKEGFTMADLATLELANHQEIRFGLISDQDLILNSAYNYTPDGESEARPTTVINSKMPGWNDKLNVFTLTNLGDGNWQVQVSGRLWYASNGDLKSGQVEGTFTYTVSGATLSEVLNNFMKSSATATVYCTEVRAVANA
jgi:hypothetical protein